jgi:hypothetical protein
VLHLKHGKSNGATKRPGKIVYVLHEDDNLVSRLVLPKTGLRLRETHCIRGTTPEANAQPAMVCLG